MAERVLLKIAVLSDFHIGAKKRSPREEDPFTQAKEAFEQAVQLGAEIILVSGDIFDRRTPSQEVWAKAMKILRHPLSESEGQVKLVDTIGKKKEDISPLALRGVPVIGIYGNHERRGRDLVDPIDTLEAAGLLIKLNQNALVLETSSEKIAIHGMGYVPEEETRNVIKIWNPKPVKDAYNILMIHQSLGQFTYEKEEKTILTPGDLPKGFDLYVSGHVHYKAKSEIHGKPLLFPGGTFRTQLLPVESEVPKGFYMIELNEEPSCEFIELKSVRDFFYVEKEFNGETISEVEEWINEKVKELLNKPRKNKEKKPLARLRLKGNLAKGDGREELNSEKLLEKYSNKLILHISKRELISPSLKEETQFLQDLRDQKIPLEEMTMKVLKSKLDEINYDNMFDVDTVYELLAENREDKALQRITETIDSLTRSETEEKE
ncbi:MAG: DNA repair exonuclease [Hadesarchaea archaeon]|nr:DNA repair exonuclease [Hadesarchaea archaeon]